MPGAGTPVVFIHGLWLHADSWGDWIDLYREAGYEPIAPGWPGDAASVEETRRNPGAVAGHGIDEIVAHYARVIGGLDAKPIAIGHSFGGLIAQRLLGEGVVAAAVALDPAPIKGVYYLPLSALRVGFVALRNPANWKRALSPTREQFRWGFGSELPPEESDALYDRWTIPSPARPLFQAAAANFAPRSPAKVDTKNATRGPLLLTAGGRDRIVPPPVVRATRKLYRKSAAVTDLLEFPDRGHSLVLDSGWRTVADATLNWLRTQSL